jgi:hypothetical protein
MSRDGHPTIDGFEVHESVTPERVLEAAQADNNIGICVVCGEDAEGVEPDAEGYHCEGCGVAAVYGAEQLLLLGLA